MHARNDETDTREFLVDAANLDDKVKPRILDVCCGTGSVILSFARRYLDGCAVGYDFSDGMLRKAQEKDPDKRVFFVEGDAAELPFSDSSFDVVVCSHALYELKGQARKDALFEMKRVVKSDGVVLIMEHEVPDHPFLKFLFNVRIIMIGFAETKDFVKANLEPFKRVFPKVSQSHSISVKSRLVSCRK